MYLSGKYKALSFYHLALTRSETSKLKLDCVSMKRDGAVRLDSPSSVSNVKVTMLEGRLLYKTPAYFNFIHK